MATPVMSATDSLSRRGLDGHVNVHKLYTPSETSAIQIMTCVFAGLSFIAAVTTAYWFCLMKRKFRHILIILLIAADVTRSVWLFLFGLVSFSTGPIRTSSDFCQVSGLLIQVGLNQADLSVLAIALHTALQIFKPNIGSFGHKVEETGLYRYRYGVYVIWALLPITMSSLAFVQGPFGYMSQGPFCTLPLRPFWYRLAISWVPRYVIMLTIVSLYVAIYIHVALQFRSFSWFGRLQGTSRQAGSSRAMTNSNYDGTDEEMFAPDYSVRRPSSLGGGQRHASESVNPRDLAAGPEWRKGSSGSTLVDQPRLTDALPSGTALTSAVPNAASPPTVGSDGNCDFITVHTQGQSSSTEHEAADVKTTGQHAQNARAPATDFLNRGLMKDEMKKRHQMIQRQVRSLFLYPLCYFLVWIMPFVNHALNYSNYYVQNPVFAVTFMAFLALSSMGFLDCVIFSIREKPWQHIPGSDGTFAGSFKFWQHRRRNRGSSASTHSGTGEEATMREPHPMQTLARPRLESVAEHGDSDSTVCQVKDFQDRAETRSESGAQGMTTWDYANGINTKHRGKEWYDRRLSEAVGSGSR